MPHSRQLVKRKSQTPRRSQAPLILRQPTHYNLLLRPDEPSGVARLRRQDRVGDRKLFDDPHDVAKLPAAAREAPWCQHRSNAEPIQRARSARLKWRQPTSKILQRIRNRLTGTEVGWVDRWDSTSALRCRLGIADRCTPVAEIARRLDLKVRPAWRARNRQRRSYRKTR